MVLVVRIQHTLLVHGSGASVTELGSTKGLSPHISLTLLAIIIIFFWYVGLIHYVGFDVGFIVIVIFISF